MIKNNFFILKNLKNVVFIGEHESLKELVKINNELNLNSIIVTSPVQKKKIHKSLDFKVFTKLDNKFVNYIKKVVDVNKTLFISIKSRWIFKKKIIKDLFKNNLVNYHPSRLPYYRGGATASWRIMNGDRIDCQLFHVVSEKVDEGPIIYHQKSVLPKDCKTPIDLENYSNIEMIKLYKNFIKNVKQKKKFLLMRQQLYLGQRYPRLNAKLNGWIDWSIESLYLSKFIDAFDEPYIGACTMYKSKKVFIKDAYLHGGEISKHNYLSGIVSRHEGEWIIVCTSDQNSIIIKKVLNSSGKNIINQVKEGDRFYTPHSKIVKSKSYKAKYGPKG
mgnify:CR=1 FL=1|tara:strand:+ start:3228 stop:4220 length:993 start_codon:yes stop_codon:yes gene_type:complete